MAAKSPEEAKASAEKATAKNAATIKARQELNAKHLADLETRFGAVGTEGGNIRPALDRNGNLILQEFKYNEKGEPVDTREVFFWVGDDGISFEILNGSQAIKKLKEGYKGNLEGLRKLLYDKKYITEEGYLTKDENALNEALLLSARKYSTYEVQKYTIDGVTKFTPYNKWLSGITATGIGDTSNLPRREFQDISKEQLNTFIDNIYLETIGRKPSEEQRNMKLQELNKIVKKGILTTTSVVDGEIQTRTKGGFNERQQALQLQEQLKTQNPLEYERRQAFEFMDELQKIMSGGM